MLDTLTIAFYTLIISLIVFRYLGNIGYHASVEGSFIRSFGKVTSAYAFGFCIVLSLTALFYVLAWLAGIDGFVEEHVKQIVLLVYFGLVYYKPVRKWYAEAKSRAKVRQAYCEYQQSLKS